MQIIKKTTIIILSYNNYESLEISLANYSHLLPKNNKLFILQNGINSYRSERSYEVAKRYENLFPNNITVVACPPNAPYITIKNFLNSSAVKEYDYICKLDDDVFPLTDSWLESMCDSYEKSYNKYGDNLGYITSLVNNNPYGFHKILDIMDIKQEYLDRYARDHIVGVQGNETMPYYLIAKDNIYTGGGGTVWQNPYISRWLHTKTTLNADELIKKTKGLPLEEVSNQERYSINCMLFKKSLWNKIDLGQVDDEAQLMLYCRKNNKKIVACLDVPMIHLFFYTQYQENKDLLPIIREYYEKRLKLPFPISLCQNKLYEIERILHYNNPTQQVEVKQKKIYVLGIPIIWVIKNNKKIKLKLFKIFTFISIKLK